MTGTCELFLSFEFSSLMMKRKEINIIKENFQIYKRELFIILIM